MNIHELPFLIVAVASVGILVVGIRSRNHLDTLSGFFLLIYALLSLNPTTDPVFKYARLVAIIFYVLIVPFKVCRKYYGAKPKPIKRPAP